MFVLQVGFGVVSVTQSFHFFQLVAATAISAEGPMATITSSLTSPPRKPLLPSSRSGSASNLGASTKAASTTRAAAVIAAAASCAMVPQVSIESNEKRKIFICK